MEVIDSPSLCRVVPERRDVGEPRFLGLTHPNLGPFGHVFRNTARLIAVVVREANPLDAGYAQFLQIGRKGRFGAIEQNRLVAVVEDPDVDRALEDGEVGGNGANGRGVGGSGGTCREDRDEKGNDSKTMVRGVHGNDDFLNRKWCCYPAA